MLDFRQVGERLDEYRRALGRRPAFNVGLLDRVQTLYAERSQALTTLQNLQAEKNRLNEAMKGIMQKGTDAEKAEARSRGKQISEETKGLEERARTIETELEALMLDIPNAPHDSVPDGKDEHSNVVVRTVGEGPKFDFEPKDHVDLGVDKLGLMDFERAAKITGTRFVVEYGALAQMERALTSFMLDLHTREHGYTEVSVPYLVNRTALTGTGQLPKFESDLFKVPYNETTDYFLVPTAEVPVTNLYNDTILTAEDGALPHSYACYTACFRSEAGAAGKDTRGMIRQHQFHKVELVRFVDPESSFDELEKLVGHAEEVLKRLGLHYRVVILCAGDMSANATKCYDIEVWLPGQDAFREISSCSNFGDFQARRAKIRYKKDKADKPRLVHTLNGSGLAVGRTLVAIIEQYQDAEGGVRVPKALQPYMGGLQRIAPKKA